MANSSEYILWWKSCKNLSEFYLIHGGKSDHSPKQGDGLFVLKAKSATSMAKLAQK